MGKKKAFIDKSKAVTFRLTPAVEQKAPIIGNPELVNVVDVTEEELIEREKYGIYYADNYNYMSHLKARNERSEFHLIDTDTLNAPETSKVARNIIEVKGREIALDSPKVASLSTATTSAATIDGIDEIDPEILEMLNEEDAEEFGNADELEDDFLNLAGGVDLPEGRRIFEEFRKNTQMSDSEFEDEEDFGGADDVEMVDQGQSGDGDKPRSILKNTQPANANKKELDAQFNAFYENMNDSDLEDEDQVEDEEDEVDEDLLENFADEYQDEKNKGLFIQPDSLSKELSLRAYQQQESGQFEETERIEMEVKSKRPKWDCESVTTTYSNIYNHPTVIREEPRRKLNPNKKKQKSNLPVDSSEQMECENDDAESVKTGRSVCSTVRSRGETSDERRERKQAVKAERRERRAEKKALKGMFKDEKKQTDAQRGHVYVSGRPIRE